MKSLEFIFDLIFPKICQKCGVEGSYLCNSCLASIETPHMFCPACDELSTLGYLHPSCQKRTQPLDALMVASKYEDQTIRNLIWQFKYNSAKTIVDDLAMVLVDFIAKQDLFDLFSDYTVTAVPLHKTRKRLRGFNQAELLAQKLAAKLKLEHVPYLIKTQKTPRQVDLEKEERSLNVKDTFMLNPKFQPAKKILLIDDVATTGSTLKECTKVLKSGGAKEVTALVLARNKS